MDGRLAIVFWIASLFGADDLRQYPTDELSFSLGTLQFEGETVGAEFRATTMTIGSAGSPPFGMVL